MNINFELYFYWMAATAPLVLFCYVLSYFLVRKVDGYPNTWPARIGGAAAAIAFAPLVMLFAFDSIREFFDYPSDFFKWFLGFFAAAIGHFAAVPIQNEWNKMAKKRTDGRRPRRKRPLPRSESRNSPQLNDDEWKILIRHDAEVHAAAEALKPLGDKGLEELRRVHEVIGDKSQLERIASEILDDHQAEEKDLARLIKKYGIVKTVSGSYRYQSLRFSTLDEAISFAKDHKG
jgi:hypothetical protein